MCQESRILAKKKKEGKNSKNAEKWKTNGDERANGWLESFARSQRGRSRKRSLAGLRQKVIRIRAVDGGL